MTRADISDKLVHFTSPGDDWEEAYRRLKSILSSQRIIAGNEKVKGRHLCVCFTEAPLLSLHGGLLNPTNYSRYSPFGVIFDKKWVFEKGGRPVIYQSEAEYYDLPESLRWRHVRYEPANSPAIDFSWEREWRIPCTELQFRSNEAAIIVPTSDWADRLIGEHEREQDYRVQMYSLVLDEFIAEQYRDHFPWRITVLGD